MAFTQARRRALVGTGIVLVAVAVIGLIWFQPQKLFIDDTVQEAPVAPRSSDAPSIELLEGKFKSLAHETTGRAIVGGGVLRLEDFETSNGPDVRVWLSAGHNYAKDFVDLGGLKGNKGDQNYKIPVDTDLDRYDTVVIWCRRFTVGFGVAKLA